MPVVNALTGESRDAALCSAVLGASNSTCAEATWSQSLPAWIGSHVRAFAARGGVPQVVGPAHLKAAVSRAHRYEPALNRTYAELAQPSDVAIVPARAARPRDKAKVEVGVPVVARWSLARLRPHTVFSRQELHTALTDLLVALNRRPFKKLPGSRPSVFAALDRPALRPLPAQPYAYAAGTLVRVHIDDHVEVDGHYSAVPYALVKQQREARLRAQVGDICHKGSRVARHHRAPLRGRHSTVAAPMPKAHQHDAAWTPQRLILWAAKTGEATAQVVETMLTSRPHPQQGFRACWGMMRLGKPSGEGQLEAACHRASRLGACSYQSIASILQHDLDPQPLPGPPAAAPVLTHSNSRGAPYYHPHPGAPIG
jgi:transposase